MSILLVFRLILCMSMTMRPASASLEECEPDDETEPPVGENCKRLRDLYHPSMDFIILNGRFSQLYVRWGRLAPARATAGLLVAIFRHVYGYRLVDFDAGPSQLCDLVNITDNREDHETFYIHTGAELSEGKRNCPEMCPDKSRFCNMAGQLQGTGVTLGTKIMLHAKLADRVADDPKCSRFYTWDFYRDSTIVHYCGFVKEATTALQVLDMTELGNKTLAALQLVEQARTDNVTINIIPMNHHPFGNNESIVFIDYDLWAEYDNVVQVPLASKMNITAESVDGHTVAVLPFARNTLLQQFAPRIHWTLSKFNITPTQIHQILDLETTTNNVVEAACAWAVNNTESLELWTNTSLSRQFDMQIVFCSNESISFYKKFRKHLPITMRRYYIQVDCNNEAAIQSEITGRMNDLSFHEQWGILNSGGKGGVAVNVINNIAGHNNYQLAISGVLPDDVKLEKATTAVFGRPKGLAQAVCHFINNHFWKRVAIISEDTGIARQFFSEFTGEFPDGKYTIKREKLENSSIIAVDAILKELSNDDARVFVLNVDAPVAGVILCSAHSRHLTGSKYVWIAREWDPKNCDEAKDVSVFSISYAWRGSFGLTDHQKEIMAKTFNAATGDIRKLIDNIYNNTSWPLVASGFVDAVQALQRGLNITTEQCPMLLNNAHDRGNARLIAQWSDEAGDSWGVVQNLRLGSEPHQVKVFVEEWRVPREDRKLLAVWKLVGSQVEDVIKLDQGFSTAIPSDGTPSCWSPLTGDDAFTARCLDSLYASACAVVAVAPLLLMLAARARKARMERRERALHVRLLARCERTAEALRPLLVPRSALTLFEELGAGHFGRVTRGLLRLPHKTPQPVAVKALRAEAVPAEEAEFLREGSALASLSHPHVVRLLAVCAADSPPLLLMEHAFFGDLLRYLLERRHLAELDEDFANEQGQKYSETEAVHVTATALTRLGREAAAAVAYLAQRRVVHRDLRAANCLVDCNRTLKLADFGLARTTISESKDESKSESTDESYAYICRRRGVFPVPWMSPESLDRGVFSAASDVWALGVLLLEIATLGGRPFPSWRPPRVLRFVRDGGKPPLPRDASYHLCELTEMCWEREPHRRASAESVRQYLSGHPSALRPALRPHDDDATAGDSGCGDNSGDWLPAEPHISTC